MKKITYIFIAIFFLGIISCESDYDDGLTESTVHPAYIYLSSTAAKVATETKSFSVAITRAIPVYEDVTVNYEVSGDGFATFSGETVFPKSTGQSGSNSYTFNVDVPSTIVPANMTSVPAIFKLISCETSSGKEVAAGLNGATTTFNLTINKYVPLNRMLFLGAYTENDGADSYQVTVSEDPADEFGFIITGGYWGTSASYKVTFNTITNQTMISNQYVGANYFGSGTSSTYDAVYYSPASPNGSFNTTTGSFTVNVNMNLPNYPYDLGDVLLSYAKN